MADIDSAILPGAAQQRFYGKYHGTVSDNQDPLNKGRIQAFVPGVLQGVTTGWAMPCAPVAGPKSGFFAVPLIGSGVWMEFEGGELSKPIWVGGFWGAIEAPNEPPSVAPPKTTQKIWRSDFGLTIAMDDEAQKVTLTDGVNLNSIVIDVKKGAVTISGIGRVVIDAPLVFEGSAKAFHPSVFGDRLLAYLQQMVTVFNAHVHPGEMALGILPVTPAPPVAPMAPPPISLNSKKVFLE
ncbi:MAG: phage baseplate assembly protein V [Pseudomonadota bacterium]|nr:phage baseplate assembly protein V [Pseudomonadota bacterium]